MSLYTLGLGFILGFVGYLPPGNINLSVVNVSVHGTQRKVWAYILFIAVMEFVYCAGCLKALDILLSRPQWMTNLEWLAVVLFFALGVLSFLHKPSEVQSGAFSGIRRGLFIAVFNPLQAPFWLVWGVYLMENKLLDYTNLSLFSFALITAMGTIAVLQLYALGGKKLVTKLNLSSHALNRIIGLIFITLSLWQLCKLTLGR